MAARVAGTAGAAPGGAADLAWFAGNADGGRQTSAFYGLTAAHACDHSSAGEISQTNSEVSGGSVGLADRPRF